jgi:hypothetical protein
MEFPDRPTDPHTPKNGSGIGSKRALEANTPIPSRTARKLPIQSLLSERRHGPAKHPHDVTHSSPAPHGPKPEAGSGDPAYNGSSSERVNPSGSGIGPKRALEANTPIPSRTARKLPIQSLLSERRHGPAKHPHDVTHSSPAPHGPKPEACPLKHPLGRFQTPQNSHPIKTDRISLE